MRKRRKASEGVQDEIRKLNQIAKTEICTRIDEKAAVDLILRLGVPGDPEVGISPVIKYRLLVGGVEIFDQPLLSKLRILDTATKLRAGKANLSRVMKNAEKCS